MRLWPESGNAVYGQPGAWAFRNSTRGKEGIGRAFFCTLVERKILILHAYIKKSQKTPARELEVARKRLAEVQRRGEKWER